MSGGVPQRGSGVVGPLRQVLSDGGPLRGLSRGLQLFVLVDVLLVAVLVVLVVTLPRDGDGAVVAAPTAVSADPTSDPGDGQEAAAVDPVVFALPSGNIACEMSAQGVTCTIGSFTYAPPPVAGCDAAGHVVGLDSEGFGFRCEDEGVPRLSAQTELAYGSTEQVGGYTCASGTDGVTCTDTTGAGFRLARSQWNALP